MDRKVHFTSLWYLLWPHWVAGADIYFVTVVLYLVIYFYIFFISASDYSRCVSAATRKFITWLHLCEIFKFFNGKLLAPLSSTRWAKTRSFWALFGGVVQHITPYLLKASTYLHADCTCISGIANEHFIRISAMYTLAQKQHRCTLKGVMEIAKFRIFAKLWKISRRLATN